MNISLYLNSASATEDRCLSLASLNYLFRGRGIMSSVFIPVSVEGHVLSLVCFHLVDVGNPRVDTTFSDGCSDFSTSVLVAEHILGSVGFTVCPNFFVSE